MEDQQELGALRARIDALETRNRELEGAVAEAEAAVSGAGSGSGSTAKPRKHGRTRNAVAAVLIILSMLLAPVAVICTWARVHLVDTDRFVATFAPLAHEPAVQAFVTDQVVENIEANVDIDGVVSDVFDGLEGLDMPERATAALTLLEGPAAEGMRSLIRTGTEQIVGSEQFASVWEATLRESHGLAIAVIQGDPDTALQLSEDGALTLELSLVIQQVKQTLVDQGVGFAASIPVIDVTIPILTSDSLTQVRTVYLVSVAAGYWLPWVVLGLLVAGIAVAPAHKRALAWGGLGLLLSFLSLGAGVGVGKLFFLSAVSPSIMPKATATALFEQLTQSISSTTTALAVLCAFLAIGAWVSGSSRAARAIRGATGSGFGAVRAAALRHGLDTRGFGRAVERWRSALMVATVAIGVLVLFLDRPVTLGKVFGTLIVVLLVLLVIELVRRPEPPDQAVARLEMSLSRPV
ncbi:MAG: hypothetical protein ACK5LO_09265 [Leucobacter sp.]